MASKPVTHEALVLKSFRTASHSSSFQILARVSALSRFRSVSRLTDRHYYYDVGQRYVESGVKVPSIFVKG